MLATSRNPSTPAPDRIGGRHRRSSMDPGTQLCLGNPNALVRADAWKFGIECRFAQHIRRISLEMKRIIRSYRRNPAPFEVLPGRGKQPTSIEQNPIVSSWFQIFSENSRRLSEEAARVYCGYKLNPYFGLFRDTIATLDLIPVHNGRLSWASSAIPNHVFLADSPDVYRNHPQIERICLALNQRFERICRTAQTDEFEEEAKSFTRTARDRQSDLMRLASHLIENAPSVHVAFVTLWGTSSSDGSPVSYETISEYRSTLFRYLRRSLSPTAYLGYTFLLKHHFRRGYYLTGFVYLRDIGIVSPSTLTKRVMTDWNTRVTRGQGNGQFRMLAYEGSLPDLERRVLGSATVLTEPDFYFQVDLPEGRRSIFPSQSPVGKLAVRTQRRNRSSARTIAERYVDPLLEVFADEEHEKQEAQKQGRWEEKTSRVALKRSKRAQAGAKTRTRQKEAATVARQSGGDEDEPPPFNRLTDSLTTCPADGAVGTSLARAPSPKSKLAAPSSDLASGSSSPPATAAHVGESISAVMMEQPDVDIATSPDRSTESRTAIDSATPTDGSLPLAGRRVSQIEQVDAYGRPRTTPVEVRRVSPRTRSSTAMKKAPNNAEANTPSAESGFDKSSPHTTSDPTE
ncbi:hypothetical protein [Burkholderia gladioli]|uniref:hypothetical protein n=1 Tax=Burkholderia gladioli TaxID=28095 RepID=UPI00163EB82E|nr:hypothetical protein [Burkholderia gladioli]